MHSVFFKKSKQLVGRCAINVRSTETMFKNNDGFNRQTNTGSKLPGRSGYVEYDRDKDPDWPTGAVNVRVRTHIKVIGNRRIFKTTKTYFMNDGEQEIIENIEQEKVN